MSRKKYIAIILIGFVFGFLAIPSEAENPPRPPRPDDLTPENFLGNPNGQQQKSNLEYYYEVEEELWLSFQTSTDLANVYMDGNKNTVNINQSDSKQLNNTMIWGNFNDVTVSQESANVVTSAFVQGSHNKVRVIQ